MLPAYTINVALLPPAFSPPAFYCVYGDGERSSAAKAGISVDGKNRKDRRQTAGRTAAGIKQRKSTWRIAVVAANNGRWRQALINALRENYRK